MWKLKMEHHDTENKKLKNKFMIPKMYWLTEHCGNVKHKRGEPKKIMRVYEETQEQIQTENEGHGTRDNIN